MGIVVGLFVVASVFLQFAYASENQDKKISFDQRIAWIHELRNCTEYCGQKARLIIAQHAVSFSDTWGHFSPDAERTILYLHSYTMYADESDFILKPLKNYSDRFNIVALNYTGHRYFQQRTDFDSVSYLDWLLDTELAYTIAEKMGKPITVMGYSMGGLTAILAAIQHPQNIDRVVLLAPALMVKSQVEDFACLGKNHYIQSGLELIFGSRTEYPMKYFRGTCELEKLMRIVRALAPLDEKYKSATPFSLRSRYKATLEQIGNLAKMIQVPVFLTYSEGDQIIDIRALDTFAKNLKKPTLLKFGPKDGIGHIEILREDCSYSDNQWHCTSPNQKEIEEYILRKF